MKFPVSRFIIHGNSMFPTLKPGQYVLIWCWLFKPKVGDIVVIKKNGKDMVKRIQKIHGYEYFVQGDNNKESTDSRSFGPILISEIVGKVVLVVR